MTYWTQNLENEPRELNRVEFHRVDLVRKGDKWHDPSHGYNDKLTVEYVTRHVDSNYEQIWYTVTFSDPLPYLTGLNIAEGLGMGTFYKGDAQ